MSVKGKCENSPHRAEIDQAARDGLSARGISQMLRAKFNEHISHTAISSHLSKHARKVDDSALELANANEMRIRNLERVMMHNTPGVQFTAWTSYTVNSQESHAITYKDILGDAIPESEALEQEYMDSIVELKSKQQQDSGLVLDNSEFNAERAEIKQNAEDAENKRIKDEEDRKIEAAKQELLEREAQKVRIQESLEKTAKKIERQRRLQALRDKALEDAAGIDENGDPIVVQ